MGSPTAEFALDRHRTRVGKRASFGIPRDVQSLTAGILPPSCSGVAKSLVDGPPCAGRAAPDRDDTTRRTVRRLGCAWLAPVCPRAGPDALGRPLHVGGQDDLVDPSTMLDGLMARAAATSVILQGPAAGGTATGLVRRRVVAPHETGVPTSAQEVTSRRSTTTPTPGAFHAASSAVTRA